MSIIRLLPASVDTPYTSEVNGQSTSLIPSSRQKLANSGTASIPSHLDDSHVWSVNIGDDGNFNFYAVPRRSSGNDTSQDDSTSSGKSSSGWSGMLSRYAMAQYAFFASLAAPPSGGLINVYA